MGLSGDLDLATSQSLHGRPLAPPTSKGIHSSRVLHLIYLTESLTGLELAGQRLGIHLSPPLSAGISRVHHHACLAFSHGLWGLQVCKACFIKLPLPQTHTLTSEISTVPRGGEPHFIDEKTEAEAM